MPVVNEEFLSFLRKLYENLQSFAALPDDYELADELKAKIKEIEAELDLEKKVKDLEKKLETELGLVANLVGVLDHIICCLDGLDENLPYAAIWHVDQAQQKAKVALRVYHKIRGLPPPKFPGKIDESML
jgi:hypothetical protein